MLRLGFCLFPHKKFWLHARQGAAPTPAPLSITPLETIHNKKVSQQLLISEGMLLFLLIVLLICLDFEQKNEIRNCNEYNCYFYLMNLGHIKLGNYER